MKKHNFYLLVYFIVMLVVAALVACQPSKQVSVNQCEHMVVKHKAYNPNHLLPYKH